MNYNNWSERDLEELDMKFDALCEHLGVEFVFEKISDGSDRADQERIYVRPKMRIHSSIPIERKITKKRNLPK